LWFEFRCVIGHDLPPITPHFSAHAAGIPPANKHYRLLFAVPFANSFSRKNQAFLPFLASKKCSFLQVFEGNFVLHFFALEATGHPHAVL
jgi:hypothetical protein